MVELAIFKREHFKTLVWSSIRLVFAQVVFGLLFAWFFWQHETRVALAFLVTFLAGASLLFVRAVTVLWVMWHMPAVWIANDRLCIGSPFQFRMHMDDIASWRIAHRTYRGVAHPQLVLTGRKGRQRKVFVDFVADKERLEARMAHLLGPETQPAAAKATAGKRFSALTTWRFSKAG